MRLDDLHEASYRKAFFFISSSGISGGRKDSEKEFANSDKQLVEDLGLMPRAFTLDGTVAARRDNSGNEITSYVQARDTLLAALEKGGVGTLIHPFYRSRSDIVCRTFNLTESVDRLGDGRISISFAISDTDGVPAPSESVLSRVSTENTAVVAAVNLSIADNYSVTPKAIGSYDDAVAQLNAVVDAINEATTPIAADEDEINEFNKDVSEFGTNITTLVGNPTALAIAISNLFAGINGLYLTVDGTFEAFLRLFNFGSTDIDVNQSTFSGVERQRNRDLINVAMQTEALSYAYLNASQIAFETVDEIEATSQLLEDQYQKSRSDADIQDTVRDALTDIRTETQRFFDDQKLEVRQTIEVETNPTSTRLLAYAYYGSSELGQEIGELNGFVDPTLVQGTVRIFTE